MQQGGFIACFGEQHAGGAVAVVNEQPTYFDDYAILRCTDLQECFEYLEHTLLDLN